MGSGNRDGSLAASSRRWNSQQAAGSRHDHDARRRQAVCENCDEVEWTAACFNYYAEIGRNSRGTSLPPVFEHQVNFTINEPYGVVAALIPWNSRCCVSHGKSRAELAAGNTVIIKPSEETALATSALAEILVGLPTA